MRVRALAVLALLLAVPLLLTACDSGDPLDNDGDLAYFVGSWRLTAVSDGTGDRTADVATILDGLTTSFDAAAMYNLAINFVEGAGTDASYAGSYAATSTNLVLVLPATETTPQVAVSFEATRESATRLRLSAPATVINSILGASGPALGLTGTVSLTITKS